MNHHQGEAEDEIKFCETHKVWYTKGMPCKPCKEDKKPKQEKPK